MNIPPQNLILNDIDEMLAVLDVCALSPDELLLAMGKAGLRAMSLNNGKLSERQPTTPLQYNVVKVAYDVHTETLLLLVHPQDAPYLQLVSLRYFALKWIEVQRLNTTLLYHETYLVDAAVCHSHVLIGGGGTNTLHVFGVSAAHQLSDAGILFLRDAIDRLACTRRENVTLVAFTLVSSVVSLQRLVSWLPLRLEPIATNNEFSQTHRLLFFKDLLLLAHWNRAAQKQTIVSFRISENALSEQRVLLCLRATVFVATWTSAGDRLVFVHWNLNLLVYEFVFTSTSTSKTTQMTPEMISDTPFRMTYSTSLKTSEIALSSSRTFSRSLSTTSKKTSTALTTTSSTTKSNFCLSYFNFIIFKKFTKAFLLLN